MTFSAAQEFGNDVASANAASNSHEPTATSPVAAASGKASKPAEAKQPQSKPAAVKKPRVRPELSPGQMYRRWMKVYGGMQTEFKDRMVRLDCRKENLKPESELVSACFISLQQMHHIAALSIPTLGGMQRYLTILWR